MATGPSTSTSPYILPSAPNVRFTSIVTVGNALPADGVFAGKPDGIGAYDNGDGTITVLVNHELGSSDGIVRDHGSRGAYVDRLVIDKATLRIISSDDLIQSVRRWDDDTNSYYTGTTAFKNFCSSDLAAPSAYFNPATGSGTSVRIYLTGEESSTGRAFATLVTGPNAGTAYELPYFGNMAFENVVANPLAQQKTIVALTDDNSGAGEGEVYFYIGQKQSSGTDIQKAGLANGDLYGLRVVGIADEASGSPANGTFRLQEIGPGGDASNMSAAQIEAESDAEGVTNFLRPEDCAWDPNNPNVFYFAITDTARLYRATFTDITNPLLGGTITAVLDGSEGQRSLDNITVAAGKVILQEDPGGSSRLARIWQYDIASDSLTQLAAFDPARFSSGGSGYITTSEESSGVLDVTALLGDSDTRAYLLDAQVHASTGSSATVERGQLMVMYVDSAPAVGNTVIFRDGGTYTGTRDTSISPNSPDSSAASATRLYIDRGTDTDQALLAFTNLFGSGPGQIPFGATITSATLTLNTVNASAAGASLHRMVTSWSESATWNSLVNGVQLGIEAVLSADLSTGAVAGGLRSFNVIASLTAWMAGATTATQANAANKGWVFIANSSDGWDFSSSESAIKPTLTVTYVMAANMSASMTTAAAADDDMFAFGPTGEISRVDVTNSMFDWNDFMSGKITATSDLPFRSDPWAQQRGAVTDFPHAQATLDVQTPPMTFGDYLI
jgi:hypothetical protein